MPIFRQAPSSLCFLVFRCSIFKVRSLPALADSFAIISHSFPLVKTFFEISQKNFNSVFRVICRFFGSPIIIAQLFAFVKRFFQLFSSFFLTAKLFPFRRGSLVYHLKNSLSSTFFAFCRIMAYFTKNLSQFVIFQQSFVNTSANFLKYQVPPV